MSKENGKWKFADMKYTAPRKSYLWSIIREKAAASKEKGA
jgi:hypothetical protein